MAYRRLSICAKLLSDLNISTNYVLSVSILASFYVWTKSLVCNDAPQGFYYLEMLQSQKIFGSLSAVRTIEPSRPDDHLSLCHTVRTPDRPSIIRPNDVSLRSDPPLCREGSIQLASVWTFQQYVRTPLSTRSISNFFPSSKKGKIDQPSGRCGFPFVRAHK
jgi:hypothetical protein